MSVIKADRFTALKAKVKAEMQRRNQSGSVESYGGSGYDYTVAPAAGGLVRAEHRDKLVEPMRAVNADSVPASSGTLIRDDELLNLETRVTAWSARTMVDQSGSDCKSGCTGTCYAGCATGCSGCTDSCTGCGSGCGTGCSGCTDSCSGCAGGCSGCGSGCTGGCTGCTDTCKNDCNNRCTGCGGQCETSVDSGCYGCTASCASACLTIGD